MRKLATIRKISEIKPIEGADKIELVCIDGWQVVTKKGEYQANDLVVYLEVDSWVPNELAPFLTSEGKEPKVYNEVKGERLRTKKLRGELSQGLVLPFEVLSVEHDGSIGIGDWKEGDDVTELLGIQKWEPTIPIQLSGVAKGNFPSWVPKTDQERIQNLTKEYESYKQEVWQVTEKLHGCFRGSQYIETWEGDTVTIKEIVENGIRPTLIGVDKNGNVVPCTVENVFINGKKNEWVTINYEPYLKSNIVGKSGKLITTPNHKIFTENMVEVCASDLNPGDIIFMQEKQYCNNTLHYIKSSLLGDGSIGGFGHYSYNECHSEKYKDYNEYIKNIFKYIPTSERVQESGYGSMVKHLKIFTTSQLNSLRKEWYPNNKKALPTDISWIDDFAVAKWYMDDGSLSKSDKQNDRANFATNAFDKSDVERLSLKLKELYGVDTTVFYAKGWRIRVNYNKGTVHSMWRRISKYIPKCMRYKLPSEYQEVDFVNYPSAQISRKMVPVKVLSISKNRPHKTNAYDIETSTHNYFCGGILVHNSSCTFALDLEGNFEVCSRNLSLKFDENNAYWKAALKYDVERKMKEKDMLGYAIQGEIIGEGLNGNQYKTNLEFYVFNIFSANGGKYLAPDQAEKITKELNLKHVPVVAYHKVPDVSMQELLLFAEGKSMLNESNREGLVYKSIDGKKSFKVISNNWLIKNE